MGIDVLIGELVSVENKYYVLNTTHIKAPNFPNDSSKNTNWRNMTYEKWLKFAFLTDIEDIFFDDVLGFFNMEEKENNGHNCRIITRKHYDVVLNALIEYTKKAILPAGFEQPGHRGPPTCDAIYARLIWLEWWMHWALNNCKQPALERSI